MKMLFKLYLLGQLIALPFMVGALGSAFGSSDSPSTNADPQIQAASREVSNQALCDALHGPAKNAVQDDIQQLKFITGELYGENLVDDCFTGQTP